MFEIFEPVIRNNCGKIFALAGVGAITLIVMIFNIVHQIFNFLVH